MRLTNSVLLTAFALLTSACAKLVVVQVPPTKGASIKIKAEGVFYALPKTLVRTQINVDRNTYKPGKYAKYAELFTPGADPVCKEPFDCIDENKTQYSLQNNATFSTFGEPDPDNVYMVKFVGRGAVDQNIALTWTETGLVSTASASATNRTSDVIVSGLKLAAGIGAKAGFGATAIKKSAETVCVPESDNDAWVLQVFKDVASASGAVDTLNSNYCSLSKEQRDVAKYKQDDPASANFREAVAAYAKNVFPLANARNNILAGVTGLFEPTELLTKIETLMDQQVKDLFLGTKSPKTWAGSIDLRDLPAPGAVGKAVLHIDPAKGICIGDGVPSALVSISTDAKPFPDGFGPLLDATACVQATPINLTLTLAPDFQLFQRVAANTTAPSGELSFRYRIPAQVRAELKRGDGTLGIGVFSVAQFGVVTALPANRHSKTLSYDLAMVEATGGLKSFKLGSTGSIDAGTVDALAGISGTLLDARNASNTADKAAALADKTAKDDLTVLTRQDALIKLKDEICTIQRKYGLDCTIQP